MRDILSRNKRIVVAVLALILLIAGIIVKNGLIGSASVEKPWERWSADGSRFGYVAAYYPENDGVTLDDVMGYRTALKEALTEASIEIKEGARGYIDAYSLSTTAEIYGTRNNNTSKVNVTVVGGDFFYMHPLQLLSGNYIEEDDLMEDRVVIDENTAWFLYGSSNVAGMRMMIGDAVYYIAGVVRPHDSSSSNKTYGNRNRIYMSYKAYSKSNPDSRITCYEAVYPDLVKNFAMKALKKAIGLDTGSVAAEEEEQTTDKNIEVVNYCTRFGIANIWNILLSYGERSSHTDGIVYPYWENEHRMIEDYLVINLIWSIICIIVIVIAMFGYIVIGCKYVHGAAVKLWEIIENKVRR